MPIGMNSRFNVGGDAPLILRHIRLHFNRTNNRRVRQVLGPEGQYINFPLPGELSIQERAIHTIHAMAKNIGLK